MMSKIEDLFVHPIRRDITTVITMDDLRLKEVEQELGEYVVTDTIAELLIEFLERYAETRTGQTDRIGVWISGFFGSGKSHFAKILSYVLENRQVGSQTAVDLFKLRIVDSPRQREIERLLHQVTNFIDTDTITFQIKTEEDLLANVSVDPAESRAGNHISTIMYRQWLNKRGFSTTLWVARLELELVSLGQYEAFQARVQELEGDTWQEVRKHDMLVRDAATKALRAILPDRYATEGNASKALDDIQAGLQMGPSILADELARWVGSRRLPGSERTPHLAYIIDEMGQFIGDSNQKLLELQSIAEAFATRGLGKLWLIVTAQEALEEIVREAIRHEDEFDKIRDRFNLRLPLTSENIGRVLEERILKKKESKQPELEKLYREASGNIATVCALQGANRPLPQPDADRFLADYPFAPYQLAVLQQVFAAVRTPGGDRERIEGTERSLIGVTQAVLKSPATGFAASPVGRLVAFDEIYDQIEAELPSIDRRTIDEVTVGAPPAFQKRILKALYLIQRLEWVPCTPENLARLLVSHVDDPETPFSALKQQVEEGLAHLEGGHYVVERSGQYEFLSGVKKDIEMAIAAVNVTVNDRRREIKKYLKAVVDLGRLNYQGIKRFDVVVRGDDEAIYDKGEVTLQVYSPIHVHATELTRDEVLQRSLGDERTVYWYPAVAEDLYRELGRLIRTDQIVSRRMARQDKSPEEESILYQKQRDVETGRGKVQTLLRQSLLNGVIIYNGEVRELEGRTSQLSTVFTREVSQVIPHVYTRFEPAAVRVNEKSIEQILTVKDSQLPDVESELNLFDDSYRLNRHTPVVGEILEELRLRTRSGDPRDGKTLSDFFERVPYGWDPILARIVLAALFRAGVVSLKHEGRPYHDYKTSRARDLLVKALDFRKTEFLYDPQEGLTPQERREVQQAIDRLFHRREPDTVNIMAAALDEEIERLKAQNAGQRILTQERDLPVKPILQEGRGAIQEILDHPQPDRRLKAFLKSPVLKDLKDYQERLQAFIEAGRPAEFRRARDLKRAVQRAWRVAPELAGSEVQGWLDEMQAIEERREMVEKWATYYQNMQPLLQRYQAAYEAQHQARYEVYARVKADLEELGISTDSLADRLCEGPVGWSLDGLTCTTCGTGLETLYYQIQSAPEEKARLVARYTPRIEEGEAEPEFKLLRLHEAIKIKNIATPKDLETAVSELRQAVQAVLETGKRVILG
ncbi:MAG: BREX system P-loop protein BrxC [Anaerolineae bacterium]|nr:BREX system P-loop protein BrxC [Anaerolineae bacterium]